MKWQIEGDGCADSSDDDDPGKNWVSFRVEKSQLGIILESQFVNNVIEILKPWATAKWTEYFSKHWELMSTHSSNKLNRRTSLSSAWWRQLRWLRWAGGSVRICGLFTLSYYRLPCCLLCWTTCWDLAWFSQVHSPNSPSRASWVCWILERGMISSIWFCYCQPWLTSPCAFISNSFEASPCKTKKEATCGFFLVSEHAIFILKFAAEGFRSRRQRTSQNTSPGRNVIRRSLMKCPMTRGPFTGRFNGCSRGDDELSEIPIGYNGTSGIQRAISAVWPRSLSLALSLSLSSLLRFFPLPLFTHKHTRHWFVCLLIGLFKYWCAGFCVPCVYCVYVCVCCSVRIDCVCMCFGLCASHAFVVSILTFSIFIGSVVELPELIAVCLLCVVRTACLKLRLWLS